jgi:L,D-transpeptidase ErfK/SrfK
MATLRVHLALLVLGCLAAVSLCDAATYPLPPDDRCLVGEVHEARIEAGETLLDLARRYGVALNALQDANPGVDPWLPAVGRRVVIPSEYLLPGGPREGIVVNLAEQRLYYFPPATGQVRRVVMTYPVGIGAEGSPLPVVNTRIIEKKADPAWVVPDSILAEHEAAGDPLPKVVPPGPDNPLGKFALRLGLPTYLIHGTNQPYGVGMRVSHGCLRLYPEDIEELFDRVAVGTPVRIVDQPYKAGWEEGVLYLEAHPPLAEAGHGPDSDLTPMVVAVARAAGRRLDDSAWEAANRIAAKGAGMPTPIYGDSQALARAQDGGTPPARPAKRWMLQVGVFRDPANVDRVTRSMRALALPVMASTVGAHRSCRVLVGPFDSREAAATTGKQIYRATGLDNLLVPASPVSGTACGADD